MAPPKRAPVTPTQLAHGDCLDTVLRAASTASELPAINVPHELAGTGGAAGCSPSRGARGATPRGGLRRTRDPTTPPQAAPRAGRVAVDPGRPRGAVRRRTSLPGARSPASTTGRTRIGDAAVPVGVRRAEGLEGHRGRARRDALAAPDEPRGRRLQPAGEALDRAQADRRHGRTRSSPARCRRATRTSRSSGRPRTCCRFSYRDATRTCSGSTRSGGSAVPGGTRPRVEMSVVGPRGRPDAASQTCSTGSPTSIEKVR